MYQYKVHQLCVWMYWPGGGALTGELTLLGSSWRTVMGDFLGNELCRSGRTLREIIRKMHVRKNKADLRFWRRDANVSVLTCIGCLGGGCLCEVAGTRCGQSQSPTLVCEVGTQRRWGVSWRVRWTRWGPLERTWGWGGWTLLIEIWNNTTTYTQNYSFAVMKFRPSLYQHC